MKKKYKVKNVKGFNMNRKSGHPSLVYWQKDKHTKSLGFETNKDKFVETKQLKHNINPKSNESCFVKTKIENQKYNDFYNPYGKYNDYRIHKEDKSLIDIIIKNDKQKNNKKKK